MLLIILKLGNLYTTQHLVATIFRKHTNLTRETQNVFKYNRDVKRLQKDVHTSTVLNILDFNCKNILTCGPLFTEMEKSIDIYMLKEHWLFDCQLNILQEIHQDYNGTGKSIDSNDPISPYQMPRGYGGVAILWRKDLDSYITPLQVGNERIQCIELSGKQNIILISIYLPCKSSDSHYANFKQCVDILHEIFETYENTHQIIIGGDFNENILEGIESQRKKYINDFISDHQLCAVKVGLTYCHPSEQATSAIDYVLYQEKHESEVLKIQKLDVVANVSDHQPIHLQYKFDHNIRKKQKELCNHSSKVNWNKVDKQTYQETLDKNINMININPTTIPQIDKAFKDLCDIIVKTTEEIVPKRKIKKRKPKLQIMSEDILKAIEKKKRAFFIWKTNGRSTDPLNTFFIEKKTTTYVLRKQCRLELAIKRIADRQKIIDARSNDTALFYKIIKQQRGKLSRFIDQLQVDNSTYETPDGIMNGWSTHFGQLAKKSENKDFDNDYLELMEREKDIILQICRDQYDHKEVSSEELLKAVKQLNTNKAADYFGITAENIIYGSNIFLNYLQKLINVSFANGHIPDSLKIGTLFPVFKNKGDIKSAKNYRGITVTPTFSKIMENIIKIRENPTIMKIQNPLQ